MPRLGRFARTRSDELVLVVLLLVGAVIAAAPRQESTIFIQGIFARSNELASRMFGWAFDLADLNRENAELRRQVAELSLEIQQLEEVDLQNVRLRDLLEFEQVRRAEVLTGAEVIGRGDGRQAFSVTISAGSAAGVQRNYAVVTADGLIGRIDGVPGARTSIVSLLNDPANAVAVVVERSRVQGVFQYVGGIGRMLHVLQAADVDTGDVIKSSGLGGIYPEGLMIGRIVSVTDDPDGVTKRVVVETSAALDRLEEVFVLRPGGGG